MCCAKPAPSIYLSRNKYVDEGYVAVVSNDRPPLTRMFLRVTYTHLQNLVPSNVSLRREVEVQ